MAVTGTETYRELITDALLDIGAATLGQSPDAAAMAHGVRHANRILKKWQALGYFQGLTTIQSATAQANQAARPLSPTRPYRIHHVNLKNASGIETPMIQLTKNEYDELPDKTSTGVPTSWYYDRQMETAILYVWPLYASVSGETYEVTYEREFEDIADEDDAVDLPVEGYDALVLSIAERLAPTYGSEQRKMTIKMDAREARDEFFASDNEGVVLFHAD